jgi:biotin synthase-related radical SAM superfamily protein
LREAGVSSVSINLEVSDPATAKRIVPGKWRLGRDRYLRALRDAVGVFGAGRVRSLLVVGLESQEHTLDGVRDIAETGAFPTLSPFRPLPGSDLADDLAPSAEFLEQVYWEARETVRGLGLALGPLCRSCQCNTLAFPWDASDAEGIGTAEGWVL